jgi:hypothetical protein
MAERLSGDLSAPRRGRGRPRKNPEAAPPNAQPEVQSNISDETFQEIYLEALGKKKEHEEAVEVAKRANAEYRAVLKRAKKVGIMPEVIVIGLNDRKLEPAEVERRLAQQNRLYRLMNLKVGTQLSLDQALDGPPVVGSDAGDAFDTGYEYGVSGRSVATLRDQTEYNESHRHWSEALRGFSQGQDELMRRPGNPAHVPQMEGAPA